MITEKLIDSISTTLAQANEIWVAVALMKEDAFKTLNEKISPECKQNYLVGIDLPTPPTLLRLLQAKQNEFNFKAAIYKDEAHKFHPKVYLIKTNELYLAFIGSANLTSSGLEDNIEMSFKTENQAECIKLLNWFNKLYLDSYPLDDTNISNYERQFNELESPERQNKIKRSRIKLVRPKLDFDPFNGIDFSDRYFKREHHFAFRKDLWLNNSLAANKERQLTENRFLELNDAILPRFYEFGLINLNTNKEGNIVSRSHQINELQPRKLDAMWLSYGKSQNEINAYKSYFIDKEQRKLQTFIHHSRLQIRIELLSIGIWILFGKENKGSIFDRDFFKESMNNVNYRNDIFDIIHSLPNEYWIMVNEVKRNCNSFINASDLQSFCKKDDIEKYFIIGRDYKITDNEMSEVNLPITTLQVFKRLFPLYDKMRHKVVIS